MEIITDQMANFRDKKTSIFPMACNLVTVLSCDELIKKVSIKNFCRYMGVCVCVCKALK